MSTDSQIRKRQRTLESDEQTGVAPPADNFIRNENFWFGDGNIVLVAQDTVFRVHSGILSRHSEVFRDMFNIPQPPETEMERIDDCPAVHLSDAKEDLNYLLMLLYDGGPTQFGAECPLPFASVSAMLRLGTKYQLEKIREEAIRRLKICFPQDPKDLRNNIFIDVEKYKPSAILLKRSDMIAVIDLVHVFDLTDILVPALYFCCQLPLDQILYGTSNKQLSTEDLYRCLRGRELLRGADHWTPQYAMHECIHSDDLCPIDNCHDSLCKIMLEIYADLNERPTYSVLTGDQWKVIQKLASERSLVICSSCWDMVKFSVSTDQATLWSELKECFNASPPPLKR